MPANSKGDGIGGVPQNRSTFGAGYDISVARLRLFSGPFCDSSHIKTRSSQINSRSPINCVLQMDRDTSTTHWASLSKPTIKDVIVRFIDEITPEFPLLQAVEKGIRSIERTCAFVGDPIERLTTGLICAWRDERLERVGAASVANELDVLAVLLEIARTEWGWLQHNPALAVDRPRPPKEERVRRVSDQEAKAICDALGYTPVGMVGSAHGYTALAFLLSIETGLRKHEALSLRWPNVFLEDHYISVDGRTVPLSRQAARLFDQLYRFDDDDRCIPLTENDAGKAWVMARKIARRTVPSAAKLDFNDSRYEAAARLAKRMDLLPLARVLDQKNLANLVTNYLEVPTRGMD